jgi:hypothetical protein
MKTFFKKIGEKTQKLLNAPSGGLVKILKRAIIHIILHTKDWPFGVRKRVFFDGERRSFYLKEEYTWSNF